MFLHVFFSSSCVSFDGFIALCLHDLYMRCALATYSNWFSSTTAAAVAAAVSPLLLNIHITYSWNYHCVFVCGKFCVSVCECVSVCKRATKWLWLIGFMYECLCVSVYECKRASNTKMCRMRISRYLLLLVCRSVGWLVGWSVCLFVWLVCLFVCRSNCWWAPLLSYVYIRRYDRIA